MKGTDTDPSTVVLSSVAAKPTFSLLGIPVRVEWFFFALAGFLGWSSGRSAVLLAAWVVIVFVSILWHEMGHALAFRAFGYPSSIVLHGMGGATSPLSPEPVSPRRDILISLAGPAAGMLLGGAVLLLSQRLAIHGSPASQGEYQMRVIVNDLLFVNIGWGIFNLLPMLPLDGGRVMAASLNLFTKGRGESAALVVSLVVGAAVAIGAFLTGYPFAALLVLLLGLGNLTALQQTRRLAPLQTDLSLLREGYEALDRRDLVTASERAKTVLEQPKGAETKAAAANLLLWTLMQEGRYKEAAELGQRTFAEHPEPKMAFTVARAWSRAGWPNEALSWLARAAEHGYRDLEELDAEPDLASLRSRIEFDQLRQRIAGAGEDPSSMRLQNEPAASTNRPAASRAGPAASTAGPEGDRIGGFGPAAGGAATMDPVRAGNPAAVEPEAGRPHAGEPDPGSRAAPASGLNIAVKAILAINLIVFLAQRADPSLTLAFGQSPEAIARGEWYRLLTPMLLHADILHIAFNSYALWIYGPTVERTFGSLRFLSLYAVAGFAGGVASYTFGGCPSLGVGASGAIFGVIGALLVYHFNRRKGSLAGRANLQGLVAIIAINLLIGFTVPQIDNFAHMGGLAGGILIGGGYDRLGQLRAAGRLSAPLAAAAQLTAVAAIAAGVAALAVLRTLNFTCGA